MGSHQSFLLLTNESNADIMWVLVVEGLVLVLHRPELFQARDGEVILHMCKWKDLHIVKGL